MKKFVIPFLIFCLASSLALYNIGNFPKMMGDEGIYTSQAYWLTHLGKLGPYTYWYDHFPLGWAQIGIWQRLAGSTPFFDHSVLSARVFIGLILGGTTILIYLLLKKITDSKITPILGSFIFITSSLTLTYGRMVLLDNLAVFWFLLSLVILYRGPTKIKNLTFSAISLSFAILSKESLLFFLPPYLLSLYIENKNNPHRNYALLVSGVTIFFLLSFFPLLAILKSELLVSSGQVSFLGTLLFQAGRGSGIPFWVEGSHLRSMISVWTSIDPLFLTLGTVATFLVAIIAKNHRLKIISLYTIFFALFLLRGGQIYDFYIIPILPLLALNISIFIDILTKGNRQWLLQSIFVLSVFTYFLTSNSYPLTSLATKPQKEAIKALKNLPNGSVIVSNNYDYLDLYLDQKHQINWYQKIETDPAIQKSVGAISNILVDEQFSRELDSSQLPYLESELLKQSKVSVFGKENAPGAIIKPYSSELLTLYEKSTKNSQSSWVVRISQLDKTILDRLSTTPPFGILIDSSIVTSSTDLENFIKNLSSAHPTIKTIVIQDDTGKNTIPWITTPSRSFYKSSEEATLATAKKAKSLQALGISSAVISSTDGKDGFTDSIVEAARPYIRPVLRYENEVPKGNTAILVNTDQEALILENTKYSGDILRIITAEEYLRTN